MNYKYSRIEKVSALMLLIVAIGVGLSQIPFLWYVDITEYHVVEPVCVGDDVITFFSKRDPRWDIQGEGWGQVIKFQDQQKIETTIIRGTVSNPVGFAYEGETTEATYATRWDEPFEQPGTYGVNEWVSIYPLPFIKVTKFNNAEDTKFEVILCDEFST